MPYFVYHVHQEEDKQVKTLEYLQTIDNYRAARTLARDERARLKAADSQKDCRMIFAKSQVEAEKLLSAPRDERVIGED